MKLEFTKMHGTGNDMILINNLDGQILLNEHQVRELCDRHFGIGADGLILVESVENADFFMNYFNSDGTPVEMCGNGIRCAAAYYLTLLDEKNDVLKVETRGGLKTIECTDNLYTVNMGAPQFSSIDFPAESQTIEGFDLHFASMGNPHAVTHVKDVDEIQLEVVGPVIETHDSFPNKINFEVFEQLGDRHLKMRVWERGCGITLACGTGACAVYTIAKQMNLIDGPTQIDLPGGELTISENQNGEILMAGPATFVFNGSITLK